MFAGLSVGLLLAQIQQLRRIRLQSRHHYTIYCIHPHKYAMRRTIINFGSGCHGDFDLGILGGSLQKRRGAIPVDALNQMDRCVINSAAFVGF
jgi:hypothetical protein